MRRNSNRRAKVRQFSKLAEIRAALIAAGCSTIAKQAAAFGLRRSTTWALLNQAKRAGPTAPVIKRILSSPELPLRVRRKVEEYVEDKISGLYGHSAPRIRAFREEFQTGQNVLGPYLTTKKSNERLKAFRDFNACKTRIQDITDALISSGYTSLDEQAKALGLHRATVWTITKNKHKLGRLSTKTIERIITNPETPPRVRAAIQEYVAETAD